MGVYVGGQESLRGFEGVGWYVLALKEEAVAAGSGAAAATETDE